MMVVKDELKFGIGVESVDNGSVEQACDRVWRIGAQSLDSRVLIVTHPPIHPPSAIFPISAMTTSTSYHPPTKYILTKEQLEWFQSSQDLKSN